MEAEIVALRQELEVQEAQNGNIEKFIQKARRYEGIETPDAYAPHELAQAICVEAPDRFGGKRVQHIRIKYGGIGFIPPEELMKRETA